jgi:hypothetical protein
VNRASLLGCVPAKYATPVRFALFHVACYITSSRFRQKALEVFIEVGVSVNPTVASGTEASIAAIPRAVVYRSLFGI